MLGDGSETVDGKDGWRHWLPGDPTRFIAVLGDMHVRTDAAGRAIVRMMPEHRHSNVLGAVHGGVLMSFADTALFAAAQVLGVEAAEGAVTVDLSAQFIGAGRIGIALEAEVEILRTTRRLIFLRGLIRQAETNILSFAGTVRRASTGTPA
ncbi:PaaI family thioesterase [Sphingomonas sanxanigenens]|uniref:Thioesterase domain-containing protein n=1 Tax=Sphingomonas sanxanigenens DSM 19645 = NX02 TaxID=1123269 RepID=W0AFF3_9SPHN|nr:PaaI family thioesterase [Sphingomonas sanxanigenens]AHE54993.1 hypothetical protein NX02_16570 [Sphingomonas sanxanigenens DSM 19645 = NX02]